MGVIVAIIVLAVIYTSVQDALNKVTGDKERADKILTFLSNLFSVLFFGYIVFWFVYSSFVTWG